MQQNIEDLLDSLTDQLIEHSSFPMTISWQPDWEVFVNPSPAQVIQPTDPDFSPEKLESFGQCAGVEESLRALARAVTCTKLDPDIILLLSSLMLGAVPAARTPLMKIQYSWDFAGTHDILFTISDRVNVLKNKKPKSIPKQQMLRNKAKNIVYVPEYRLVRVQNSFGLSFQENSDYYKVRYKIYGHEVFGYAWHPKTRSLESVIDLLVRELGSFLNTDNDSDTFSDAEDSLEV